MINVDSEVSVLTLATAPLRHKFKAMLAFIVPVALAVISGFVLAKGYRSDAMIFVRLGRESVSLDPTATTGSTVPVLESRENEVNSIRDMLYSSSLIEMVVDRIGRGVVLGDAPLGQIRDAFPHPPETDYKGSRRQEAIKVLSEKIDVISARKSSVLVAVCQAPSPKFPSRR